jgi:RHS repeat-associated protein
VTGKRLQSNQTLTGGTVKTLNMDAIYAYDSEGKNTSVAYPTTYAWNGTTLVPTAGPTYTYSFDAMDRATGLKDQNNNVAVSGVTYNAANQYLTVNYFGANETRTYNSMNQMTHLSIPGSLDISYNFVSGADNGKIGSQKDNISGETVTYQYDSLKRLISASGSGWGETYGYDSFGNLTSKTPTGTAPTLLQAVNPATNQIVGQTYDANGNQLSGPLASVTYDPENRIVTAPGVQYAYDSTNKRIWRGIVSGGAMTAQEVYFYSANGRKLATYAITANAGASPYLANSVTNLAIFFRSKRIGITTSGTTSAFIQNRLGSQGSYYPYGEDRGTPLPNDQMKFATYTRDSATGLDYANQRYYVNNFGRFMTPDPYRNSPNPKNPPSWNLYDYVLDDPLNLNDPTGLCELTNPNCVITLPPPGSAPCAISLGPGCTFNLGDALVGPDSLTPGAATYYPSTGVYVPDLPVVFSVNSAQTSGGPQTYNQLVITLPVVPGFSAGVAFSYDSNGNAFVGPVANFGLSSNGPGVSLVNGSLPPGVNSTEFVQGQGLSWGLGVGFYVGGQGSSTSVGNATSTETGISTPQAGVGVGFNVCISGTTCTIGAGGVLDTVTGGSGGSGGGGGGDSAPEVGSAQDYNDT